MKESRQHRLTGWGDHITSTVSVTLVLFILGLVGFVNITFHGVSRQLKEKIGFTVVLADSISSQTADSLTAVCSASCYISEYQYLSADDVLAQETQGDGAELVELLGVNPYAPMIEIKVKEAYANVDSVAAICARWQSADCVAEVTANSELIRDLNRNAGLINTILIVMAAALLLISFVLINNTVRLTVYSRRFLIHTMKLVGATDAFIRRPFLLRNALQGLIAGIVASGCLAAFMIWARSLGMGVETVLDWESAAFVFATIIVLGIIICVVAAFITTGRYLHKSYDEMFD